eukprot:scaffold107379_cov68-Phaeocystis_antarctica.AAC.3
MQRMDSFPSSAQLLPRSTLTALACRIPRVHGVSIGRGAHCVSEGGEADVQLTHSTRIHHGSAGRRLAGISGARAAAPLL